jgi:hypothetical protein
MKEGKEEKQERELFTATKNFLEKEARKLLLGYQNSEGLEKDLFRLKLLALRSRFVREIEASNNRIKEIDAINLCS